MKEQSGKSRSSPGQKNERPASSFGALLLAVAGAAACEASVAAFGSYQAQPRLTHAVVAWVLAFALMALASAPLVLALGLLLDNQAVRRLGKSLAVGFGGLSERGSVALGMLLLALAGAFGVGLVGGNALVQGLSPVFAAGGTTLLTLVTLVFLAVCSAWTGTFLGSFLDRLVQGFPSLARVPGTGLVIGCAGLIVALSLGFPLGVPYALLPIGAAWALSWSQISRELFPGGVLPSRLSLSRLAAKSQWLRGTRGGVLATFAFFGLFLPAGFLANAAPASAQGAILFKAPYLSVLVAGAERAADADGDGYSTILFGKDCNDGSERVHPGAQEVPNNGVDENCSGGDASEWVTIPAPNTPRPKEIPTRTNILMIMVDALRPDRLHFAGYHRETSPHLDEFQKKATWFKNAFTTSPQTRDALATVLSGKYPFRLNIKRLKGFHTLPNTVTTFPELLRGAGYNSLGYTITYVDKRFRGYGQGFRSFAAPWGPKPWRFEWKRAAPLTTEAALKQLGTLSQQKPWMMFLHYRCTHDPYYVREKNFGRSNSDKYDSGVHHCDSNISKVLQAAEARQDADRTAIFLFSDHGELFGEHGAHYHAETLFEPDVRVLLLAKVPGAPAGRIIETPVNLADLGVTMADLGRRKLPGAVDGWSLLPLLFEGQPDPAWNARPLFVTTDLHRANIHYRASGVIQFPYKYLWDMRTGMRELYNIVEDPEEQSPLSDKSRKAAMEDLLEQWLASGDQPKRDEK